MNFETLIELYNSSASFREAVDADPVAALQSIGYSLEEATETVRAVFEQGHEAGKKKKNC
ncbi:MAG: hypothetical protein AAF677_13700 [Pseudomonadota bacterium]